MRAFSGGVLVALLGLTLSAVVALREHTSALENEAAAQELATATHADAISDDLIARETMVAFSAKTFAPERPPLSAGLDRFAARALPLVPNVFSMVWIVRVPTDSLYMIEAHLGAKTVGQPPEGSPAFAVIDIMPRNGVNERSLGLVLNSMPGPRAALQRAEATDRVSATPPLRLVQDPSDPALVAYGVVRDDFGTPVGAIGYSFKFKDLLRVPAPSGSRVQVVDADAREFGPVLGSDGAEPNGNVHLRTVSFGGRTYELRYVFPKSPLSWATWGFGLVGALFSILIGATTTYVLRLNNRLTQAVSGQNLVVRELNHRIGNVVAVASSLASQTFRDPRSKQALSNYLVRLQSLVVGVDVDRPLTTVHQLVAKVASSHPQVKALGPPTELSREAAQILGLIVHELTTNSLKYGALARGGDVSITWSMGDDFAFEWREGSTAEPQLALHPAERAPEGTGFGTKLLTRLGPTYLGGKGSLSMKDGGLEYVLRVPSSRLGP